MGVLDIMGKKEEKKPDGSRPYTVTFSRGAYTPGQHKSIESYGLTPLGKSKIKLLEESDARYQILIAIEENGPSSIGEIAERIHLSTGKTENLVKGRYGLVQAGCLKIIGRGGE